MKKLENKKRTKGFTLVELLAVVVVLTLVAGISVAVYLNTIRTSKKKATLLAINGVKEAAYLYSKEDNKDIEWVESYDQEGNSDGKYACVSVQQLINKGYFNKSFFDKDIYEEKINSRTFIEVSMGQNADNVSVKVNGQNTDKYKCLNSAINHNTSKLNIKYGDPYTDRISFEMTPKDEEVKASSYTCSYTNENGEKVSGTVSENKCSIEHLKDARYYKIQACMVGEDNGTYCDNFNGHTAEFVDPDIKIDSNSEWKKEKNISITYSDKYIYANPSYYLKSEVDGQVKSGTVLSCTGDDHSTCVQNTKEIKKNGIYKISTKTVSFVTKDNIDKGKYEKIMPSVYDDSNNFKEVTGRVSKIDNIPPVCNIKSSVNGWTNKSVLLTNSCDDGNGSGCRKKTYTKLVEKEINSNVSVDVYDKVGNKSTCKALVQIDKTAPTCKASYSGGVKGNNGWYKSGTSNSNPVVATGKCTDGGSGCTKDTYTITTQYANGKHKNSITISDKVGNKSVCISKINIDSKAPSCTSSGGSSSWTKDSRTLKGTCSDSGSGCVKGSETGKKYDSSGNVTWLINSDGNWSKLSPGTVYDSAGNSTVCPADQTVKIDKTPPTCVSSGGSSNWSKGDITLVGTCSDSGSGCKGNASKKISAEGSLLNVSPGTVYDNVGNSTVCPANQTVKIDKTAPSCVSSGGSSNWTNSNVKLLGKCSDNGSGCKANAERVIEREGNWSSLSPGTVTDEAGNTATCPSNQTAKIDKTAPSCTSSGGSNSWSKSNITLLGTCSDSVSGCKGNATKLMSNEGTWNNVSPGTVYDNAGNSTTCPANQTAKIDKTAPSCVSSGGSSNWTNSNVKLLGKCSDNGSGCKANAERVIEREGNWSSLSPGTVTDEAGNSTTCPSNQTAKIDKTAPSCTSSGGSDNWSKNDITLLGTCSDSVSGCKGNVAKTMSNEGTWNNISPGTVYDNAGNSTTCPANQTAKIDKTPPTCVSSGGSSNWTNKNVTLVGTCSDNLGSCNNVTKTYDKDGTWSNVSPGTVTDPAGNTTTCPANQTVKIDKTPPTCVSSGGSNDWTKNSRTLKGTCSDSGSGCVKGSASDRTYDNSGNVAWLIDWTGSWTNRSPGTVYDAAGNSTTCPANQTVKVDKVAPTVKIIADDYNYNFSVENSTTYDKNSGIKSYKWGGGSNGGTGKTTKSNGSGSKVSLTVTDNAGNSTTVEASGYKYCSQTEVNQTKPSKVDDAKVEVYYWGDKQACNGKNRNYNKFREYGCQCKQDKATKKSCGTSAQWEYDTHNNNQATIHYDSESACKDNQNNHIDYLCSSEADFKSGFKNGSGKYYFHGLYWINGASATGVDTKGAPTADYPWTISSKNVGNKYSASDYKTAAAICKKACDVQYGTN